MTDLTHPLDILLKKRDGGELSPAEMQTFVAAVVRSGEGNDEGNDEGNGKGNGGKVRGGGSLAAGDVSEAQIASFLMAVFQRGLSERELAALTQAMRFSGEVFDASSLDAFTVDKHSTGGVGDKTSLLIAPMLAAAGAEKTPALCVPMISGRSLGHTGGTLDKLETIPGFDTQLSLDRMREVLRSCHAAMVGQTPRLVPADRILYALRDHTGTVESPFLITASIMSKKLAEDLRGLVLDVKVGSGAFMPTYEASRELAALMVATGERAGTRTVALLTGMDEPLGRFAGNWVEVWECVEILKGRRGAMSRDLIALSCVLAGWMLFLAGKSATPEAGARLADSYLRDGRAYAAWLCLVRAQGGQVAVFDEPALFHKPRFTRILRSPVNGYLAGMDCKQVGWAVQRLGAGRNRPGEPVSAHAGIEVHAKIGTRVEEGQPIFTLFSDEEALLERSYGTLEETLRFSPTPVVPLPLVREVVQG